MSRPIALNIAEPDCSHVLSDLRTYLGEKAHIVPWEDLKQTIADTADFSCILVTDTLDPQVITPKSDASYSLTIVLYAPRPLEEQIGDYEQWDVKNLIAFSEEDPHQLQTLAVTLKKLLTQDIFGIEKYAGNAVKRYEWKVRHSEERMAIIDQVSDVMGELTNHAKFRIAAETVVDEMLTNALYHAPVDTQGTHTHTHDSRTVRVEMPEQKEVHVQCWVGEQALGLSVMDRYGSLSGQEALHLALQYAKTQFTPRMGPGGAGLGIVFILKNVSHMVVNIAPGESTEMIAWLYLRPRYSDFAKMSPSFNIFVKSEDDSINSLKH